MSSQTSKSTMYTFHAVRCLFETMGLTTDDGNVLSLLKAAEAAMKAPTESEALRTLAFAWDCCGVPQPGATYHAIVMLEALKEEESFSTQPN